MIIDYSIIKYIIRNFCVNTHFFRTLFCRINYLWRSHVSCPQSMPLGTLHGLFVGWLPGVRGNQHQIHKSLIIKGRLLNKQMATLTFWAFSAFLKMSKMPILPCFIINNVDNYSQQWRQFQRAVYKDNWCQLKLQLLSISFLIKNQRTLLLLLIKMQHFALVSKTKFIYQQCGQL